MKSLKSAKALRDVIDVAVNAIEGLPKKDVNEIIEISKYKEDIDNFRDVLMTLFGNELYGTTATESMIDVIVDTETHTPTPTVTAVSKMNWLKYKGNIKWKLDKGIYPSYYKNGMMISEEGDVWDLTSDSLLETGFYDGEMKVIIPGDRFATHEKVEKTTRIAPMVARVYGVPNDPNQSHQQMVIDYIDGDRRNLRPSNLRWIKKTSNNKSLKTLARIIADDICRRLVDNNGDVEKTLEMYPTNNSNITSKYISDIRFKLIETDLSDKYFTIDTSGNFISKSATVEVEKEEPKKSVPVIPEISMMTDDILESRIRTGRLSIADKNLILFKTINALKQEKSKLTPEIVVDAVRDKYKISLPTDMADMMLKGGLS